MRTKLKTNYMLIALVIGMLSMLSACFEGSPIIEIEGSDTTLDIQLVGTVNDYDSHLPIEDVTISVVKSAALTIEELASDFLSDMDGKFTLPISVDTETTQSFVLELELTKDGYSTQSYQILVDVSQDEIEIDIGIIYLFLRPQTISIDGTILDGVSGEGMEGVVITVMDEDNEIIGTLITNPDGSYDGDITIPLGSTDEIKLIIGEPGYETETVIDIIDPSNTEEEVNGGTVTMNPVTGTNTVTGLVLDSETGEPVPHAVVTLIKDGEVLAVGTTSTSGTYSFDIGINELDEFDIEVVISQENYKDYTLTASLDGDAEDTIVDNGTIQLEPDDPVIVEKTIHGLVKEYSTELALEDVTVDVFPREPIAGGLYTTIEDGSFEFTFSVAEDDTSDVQLKIEFSKDTYANKLFQIVIDLSTEDSTIDIGTVYLTSTPQTIEVTGTLLDDNGDPLNNALVTVTDANNEVLGTILTKADGTYTGTYTVPIGSTDTINLVFEKDGFVSQTSINTTDPNAEDVTVDGGTVSLDPVTATNTVTGTILAGDTGLPTPNATVTLMKDGNVIGVGTTSTSGEFSIDVGIDVDDAYDIDVVIAQEGYDSKTITASLDGDGADPVIDTGTTSLDPEATEVIKTIEGVVVSQDTGLPIAGVTITTIEGAPIEAGVYTTGADGSFSIPFTVDSDDTSTFTFDMTLSGTGLTDLPYQTNIDLSSGDSAYDLGSIDMEIDPQTITVSGTLLDDLGSPLSGATVTVTNKDGVELGTITTNPDGTYTEDFIVPLGSTDEITLEYSMNGYETSQQVESVDTGLSTVTIDAGSVQLNPVVVQITLTGVVHDKVTSAAIAGVTVEIEKSGTPITSGTTNASGQYSIEISVNELDQYDVDILLSKTDYVGKTVVDNVDGDGTTTVDQGTIELSPIRDFTIEGIVHDGDTTTVLAGATVNLIHASSTVDSTATNASGAYSFTIADLASEDTYDFDLEIVATDYLDGSETDTVMGDASSTTLDMGVTDLLYAVKAVDDTYTATAVYAGRADNIINCSQLLSNDIDRLYDPKSLVVQELQNPVNATPTLAGDKLTITLDCSSASADDVVTFDYKSQNSDGTFRWATVSLTVQAAPPLIAVNDSGSMQQSAETYFLTSTLIANDSTSCSPITLDSVQNPVGGTVSKAGSTITFVSTGLAYETASFEYVISDNCSNSATGTVFISVTPLPPLDGYVFDIDGDFQSWKSSYEPWDFEEVFNNWPRFNNGNYYPDKDSATGEAADWIFATSPDRVEMPTNSSDPVGIVSQETFENYTFEATLTSVDNDDDSIGLVMAFDREGGNNYYLAAVRTQGGFSAPGAGWGVVYYENGVETVISSTTIGTESGAWSGRETRVKVERAGDIFKVYCTDWDNTGSYEASSEIVIDLTSDARFTRFMGESSYGYLSYSQPDTTYLDVTFDGNRVDDYIFNLDVVPIEVWQWNYSSKIWEYKPALTVQDVVGYVREVTNPSNTKTFMVYEDRVELQ